MATLVTKGTAGFVDPYTGANASYGSLHNMKHTMHFIAAADNAETVTIDEVNVQRIAWEQISGNNISCTESAGTVTFAGDGAANGIIHVFARR